MQILAASMADYLFIFGPHKYFAYNIQGRENKSCNIYNNLTIFYLYGTHKLMLNFSFLFFLAI